jgi:threonine dehydrogenase-like Zn-dependent dehydrogenase
MPDEKTRALTYTPRLGKLEIRDIPLPRPEPDEVLVRLLLVGLTGKDAAVIAHPAPSHPPGSDFIILGHIALGRVVEAGALVRHLAPGDLVVPMVRRDCGHCIDGRADLCPRPEKTVDAGLAGAHGFAREHLVDKGRHLIRVPREVGEAGVLLPHLAAVEKAHRDMTECLHRFQFFCYHEEDPSTLKALVTGLGPTGILAAFLLSLSNCRVTVFGRRDEDDARAAILKPIPAEYVNATRFPIAHQAAAKKPFRLLVETTGDPEFILSLFPLLGNNPVMTLMGTPAGESRPGADLAPVLRRVVEGNFMIIGSTKADRDAYEAASRQILELSDLYRDSLVRMTETRFSFEDYARALAADPRLTILPLLQLA